MKLAQICHKILSFLLSVWDRSGEPIRSNHTIFEGYVDRKDGKREVFMTKSYKDLEGLDERRKETQVRSRRYRQRMIEAYGRTIKERMFTEGQLMLRTSNYVRRGTVRPSKFSPKWEGRFMVWEAHAS